MRELERMNALGASLHEGTVGFRVWAPRCRSVDVVLEGRRPVAMRRGEDGLWDLALPDVRAGTRYRYRLDGERSRPDPVSRYQPDGVHGHSVVVDPAEFVWTDREFPGHEPADLVVYELHVGAYTAAGTFEGIIPRLGALRDLGVTAIELMPVAEFPGSRNWGYDGVHLFAPQSTYGGPRGRRRLVDACHARGLSVILDVVYNHLGPEGNYLAEYGPYFTDRYRTPWGLAVNFDGPESGGVRGFVIENARAWVREFHIDGLRLDAIHAIWDASPVHILAELAEAVRAEARALGRRACVIAESHDNDRRLVLPCDDGGLGLDAVWSDDFHHTLHTRLTGERTGYYVDFVAGSARTPSNLLRRVLTDGFAYQGEHSEYFGRARGTPSADLEGDRFVVFLQNHDQVGNRARGDRLSTLVSFEALKLAAAVLFIAPAIPLLFMGEEYGETAPFQFFTSFLDPALAEAVRQGRAKEFERFAWQGTVPDPGSPATFVRSRLDHSLATARRHRELREYYHHWLGLRRSHPALGARGKGLVRASLDPGGTVLTVTRGAKSGPEVALLANLTPASQPVAEPPTAWRILLDSDDTRFAGTGSAKPLQGFQVLLYEATR